MIDDRLMQEAERLAARPYAVSQEIDSLGNGERIYLLRNPEMPAVKAQGADLEEANRNLYEARVDYIYSLLEDNLTVPSPVAPSRTASSTNGRVWTLPGTVEQTNKDNVVVTPGGDLVRHS